MNDLQKKLFIVGLTAFIFWFLLGYRQSNGLSPFLVDDFDSFIGYFITRSYLATGAFITWLGSLIAFNIYKD